MSDLISRQEAIEHFRRAIEASDTNGEYNTGYADGMKFCVEFIRVLPSAEPERKKGEWMEHYSHEDGERDGVTCSECGTHYYFGGQLMNFCPNCGSYNGGGENVP